MFSSLKAKIRSISEKVTGNNILFRHIISTELKRRNYMRAFFLMLYLFPVRKYVRLDETLRKCSIFTSPDYYKQLQDILHIAKTEGFELVRTGRENDGGYILLNDFHPGGIAYSFGINDDVSWDKDMASRGYDVFMYDHTINGLPEENARFHWSKFGISDGVTQDERLKTLEELIALNGHEHEHDMILKMDVEGAEWGFLENVKPKTLSQFTQILFEFHGMTNPHNPERILNALRKINKTHQLIHIHPNNNASYISSGGKIFCNAFEASYSLREKYMFVDDYDVNLPLELDMPDAKPIPETVLGRWNVKAEITDSFTVTVRAL